jgi:hypothetical protein
VNCHFSYISRLCTTHAWFCLNLPISVDWMPVPHCVKNAFIKVKEGLPSEKQRVWPMLGCLSRSKYKQKSTDRGLILIDGVCKNPSSAMTYAFGKSIDIRRSALPGGGYFRPQRTRSLGSHREVRPGAPSLIALKRLGPEKVNRGSGCRSDRTDGRKSRHFGSGR